MRKSPVSVCFYCADQNPGRDRSRGITTYTHGLLSHLRNAEGISLSALVSRSSFDVPEGIERVTLPFGSNHFLGRLAADHLHPVIAGAKDAQIWHYPKGFLPFPCEVRGKKIGTVADVMIQFDADHHPESRSKLAFAYWLKMLKHSIQHLDLIITVSDFSKNAIYEFCERYGLKCPPIVVTYQGVSVTTPKLGQFLTEKRDYVVHLASDLPYKGTRWLLEQWASLAAMTNDLPQLNLVGRLDTRASAIFSRMANVSLVPELPRIELEELIAKSRGMLLPSEIEGFGIPAVEGYLLGTPVAYAKGTALEETVGRGSPGGFERDRDSLHSALTEILNMEESAIERKADSLRLRYNWDEIGRAHV